MTRIRLAYLSSQTSRIMTGDCLTNTKKMSCNYSPAYAYPQFKTHKLTTSDLNRWLFNFDIPVRLLQASGHICTSRITAFLEATPSPVSIQYCTTSVDEYCKDSRDYLLKLMQWKNTKDQVKIKSRPIYT